MRGPKPASRIAIGQVALLVAILLLLFFGGGIPSRHAAVLEGRARLAEALAANSSAFLGQRDLRRLEADLKLVLERDPDLLSAAVRRTDGEALIELGNHREAWHPMLGERSTESQVRVPIWAGRSTWGQLELRFESLTPGGWRGFIHHPWLQVVGIVAFASFLSFRIYLGKMLKHLDPAQAIPARVRTALDTMAEGLLVLDRSENIVLANQAFAEILGEPPDALMGLRPSSLAWTDQDGAPLAPDACPWRTLLASGEPQRNELVHLNLAGRSRKAFIVNCSPILGAGSKHVGALISFDDVTELEEKEIALKRSMAEAEAANLAKSQFLANMSHEIRTPMTAILGFTDVLSRRPLAAGDEESRFLRIIHSSGRHLLELINDVLDLSKVESGRLEIEQIACAPHQILYETVQAMKVKAQEKGIALDLEIDGPVPDRIVSDPARLRQIVTNLIGNAIRFTETGGVRVVERLERVGSEPTLVIDVIDSGLGIPADKLDAIFDAFVQADVSTTRRFGGTGLGLSISRKLAQLLGGDVSVQSRLEKGSTFTVRVSAGSLEGMSLLEPEAALASCETSGADAAQWSFTQGRVLVVDDIAQNRELARIILEEAGLEVEEAENGAIAVEMVQEREPNAVLMDIQMPVMDGYTAVGLMREAGADIPIYALTAHAMKGIVEECEAAGYSGHIPKPIDAELLLGCLARVLAGARRVEPSGPADPGGGAAPAAGQGCEDEPIVSKLAGNPRIDAVIRSFPDQLAKQLDAMETAWAKRDFEGLRGLAHTLKGSNAGFDAFYEPSGRLEQLARNGSEDGIEEVLRSLRFLEKRIVVPEESR